MKSIYVDITHPGLQRQIDEAYIRGLRDGREQAYLRFMKVLEDECGTASESPDTALEMERSPTTRSTTDNPSGAT